MPGKDRLRGRHARIGRSFRDRTLLDRSSASPKMRRTRTRAPRRSPEAARVWQEWSLPLAVCLSWPSCPSPSCRRFLLAPSAFYPSLSKAYASWESSVCPTPQQSSDYPANTYISMSCGTYQRALGRPFQPLGGGKSASRLGLRWDELTEKAALQQKNGDKRISAPLFPSKPAVRQAHCTERPNQPRSRRPPHRRKSRIAARAKASPARPTMNSWRARKNRCH